MFMLRGKLHQRSITKSFKLPAWNQETRQKIISFWSVRGFEFTQTSDNTIVGTRGSLLSNLTSFDMNKLITRLTISVDDSNTCTCILDVNTFMQTITSWNTAHWQLELDTLESYVLYDDMKEKEWADFQNMSAKGNIRCVILIFIMIVPPMLLMHYLLHAIVR